VTTGVLGSNLRPEKIPYVTAWLLMLVASAVRLYYFALTAHQPVWWDEAEYLLKGKALALGTPETGYFAGAPPLLPLLLAAVFWMGLGEITIRLLLVMVSVLCVYLTYRVGRLLFGEWAALAGAWLFGCFYLEVFLSMRIMTEVPHLALVLKGFESLLSARRSWPVVSGIAFGLAVFIRYPAALMFVPVGVYLLLSARASLRDRATYLFLAVSGLVAAPFLVMAYLTYGDALYQLHASQHVMPPLHARARLAGLMWYATWLRSSLGLGLSAVVALGLLVSGCCVIWSRFRWARSRLAGGDLLLLMWIATPLLYFGASVRPLRDRYLILVLPPLLLIAGRLLVIATEWLGRFGRWQPRVPVAALVVAAGLSLLLDTNRIVDSKRRSYLGLQEASSWLVPRLPPDAVVVSRSVSQLTYYTSRAISDIPTTRVDFERFNRSTPVDYLVLTEFEPQPPWLDGGALISMGFREVAAFPYAAEPDVLVFAPVTKDRSR
jgi:4-amino-4-deoxy-L-arabinose transferase-like glycosyltransferase